MNFTFTWIMDKLGFMPKIDMQVGKVVEAPWPFPAPESTKKKRPTVQKATTRKPVEARFVPAKKKAAKKAIKRLVKKDEKNSD